MSIHRTRSTTARSALALGALTAMLVLSPVAVSVTQAAPAHHGAVTETAAGAKYCYKIVGGGPGRIGIRVPYYCGDPGQA